MWLLSVARAELHEFIDPPEYAILSHVWGDSEDTFKEMQKLRKACTASGNNPRDEASSKIRDCCLVAEADGFKWLWVDTCCIDKSSSAELSEAINSMCAWYAGAKLCYVYLQDVQATSVKFPEGRGQFSESRWFTRGWTLQELMAPPDVLFLSSDWSLIGRKQEEHMRRLLWQITRVDTSVLEVGLGVLDLISVARSMSWAARRSTTRVEDRAYSLMGIFGVNMPIIYGEGERAFFRLQMEILQRSPDQTIFVWCLPISDLPDRHTILAQSPSAFAHSDDVWPISTSELAHELQIPEYKTHFVQTGHGVQARLPMLSLRGESYVALACRQRGDALVWLHISRFSWLSLGSWTVWRFPAVSDTDGPDPPKQSVVAQSDYQKGWLGIGRGATWEELYFASPSSMRTLAPRPRTCPSNLPRVTIQSHDTLIHSTPTSNSFFVTMCA